MSPVPIHLAVEDDLSEWVLRRIVRRDSGGNLRQGPAYNSTLADFVNKYWDLEIACSKCPSLRRMLIALSTFEGKL